MLPVLALKSLCPRQPSFPEPYVSIIPLSVRSAKNLAPPLITRVIVMPFNPTTMCHRLERNHGQRSSKLTLQNPRLFGFGPFKYQPFSSGPQAHSVRHGANVLQLFARRVLRRQLQLGRTPGAVERYFEDAGCNARPA